MRSFRKSKARLPLSVLCIIVMVMSIMTTALGPLPVLAQGMNVIPVAVVDFSNNSKIPGPLFGRMATDAIVVELLRSGRFAVTPAEALEKTMKQLGYEPPLTPSMQRRLGQEGEIGAASIVSGEVLSLKIDKGKKEAEARIAVRMLDVTTGELVNGAVATGVSHSRIGYNGDEDKLLVEAISDAAKVAVEVMVQYILPEATVLSSIGTNDVLLNKGSQDGLEPGMEMIVLRRTDAGDDVVGRVRVTKVSDTDATALVVRAPKGVKPEDRVRAVYQLPSLKDGAELETPRKVSETKKRISKGTKTLFTILGALGLIALLNPSGNRNESVAAVVAEAGVTPDVIGEWTTEPCIRISWNKPRDVREIDIVEYHIWRNNRGWYGGGATAGNIFPIAVPMPWTAPAANGYDHTFPDEAVTRQLEGFNMVSDDHTALVEASHEDPGVPGFEIGKPNTYWVSAVYKRQHPQPQGGAPAITYWETVPMASGISTALNRPVLTSLDTPNGDLTQVTFSWASSGAADTYRIEVSTVSTFARDKTWVHTFTQRTSSDGMPMVKSFSNVLSAAPELATIPADGILYWRVGARSSVDVPGPIAAGPSPQATGDKNTRFIYSHWEQFEVGSPPFPGGGDSGGGSGGGDTPPPPPVLQ